MSSIFTTIFALYVAADDMLQMIIEITDSIRNDDDKINTQRLASD